jgi:glycosyltransferase involved in cell wall biosynthesis
VDLSGYSLVHVHRIYFAIPFLLLKPGLKVVCTQHGRTFSVFQERYGRTLSRIFHPIARMIERFALKRVDRLVFVSQDVADTFAVKYPILMADCETRTSILGSMVELEGFGVGTSNYLQMRYGGDNRYILFLGRLSAVKDLGFLIELASCELQDQPQTKLILVGDGEDAGQLQEKAAALCSANMPLFHGPISATDVPALLQSADLLILCSQHEASPTVIKEALATGLPVLTNDVGDAKDFVISGKNGRVVQKTVKRYMEAIEEILGHTLSREVVFRASESRLVQCTPEFVSKEYSKVYRSLVRDLASGVSPS